MTPSDTAAPTGAAWTEERIRATLASEPYNYQAVQLPFGLSTGGYDRKATADLIFEGDWAGQSVLDVGSSLGYFLFEARRHGAGRCVGADLSADKVRRASTLADMLDLPVEFRVADLDAAPVGEVFDNVLCLNVLHHLQDPILGLNRLVEATRRRLVLEVATVGGHDRRKLGLGWLQASILGRLPAIVVGRGTAGEGIKQFYLTIAAIENLLRYRRGCFAFVESRPSGFKNRFLVLAEKRRIGRLAVVAGPPGADLAGTASRLADGGLDLPELATMRGAAILDAADYHRPQPAETDRLVFAYDIMRPVTSGAVTYDHDPALDLVGCAAERRFITVWRNPAGLLAELATAAERLSGRRRKTMRRAIENMSGEGALVARYRDWFRFAEGRGRHTVLDADSGRLMSVAEWETLAASAPRPA